ALQNDGSIIVAGNGILNKMQDFSTKTAKPKRTNEESAYISIDQSGILYDVPAGQSIDILLLRLKSNGELDKDFGENGVTRINIDKDDAVQSLLVDVKDNIYVSGVSEKIGDVATRNMFVAKVKRDGKPDFAFADYGKYIFNETPYTLGGFLALDKSTVYVAGLVRAYPDSKAQYLEINSLNNSGKPNIDFGKNGKFTFDQLELAATDCQLNFAKKNLIVTAGKDKSNGGRHVVFMKLSNKGVPVQFDEAPYKLISPPHHDLVMDVFAGNDYLLLGGCNTVDMQNRFEVLKINYNGELVKEFGENGVVIGGYPDEMNLGMHVFEDKKQNVYITGTTGWIDMKYAAMKIINELETSFEDLSTTADTEKALEISTPNLVLTYPNPVVQADLSMKINLAYDSQIAYSIFDQQGKQLASGQKGMLMAGTHQLEIPIENLASGNYFIQIISKKDSKTIKIQILH
ncbi:MAG: T9SS type A sorting domain-containing protein, partial [Saprospiraceae bacterium]